jgi:hypothetical protein
VIADVGGLTPLRPVSLSKHARYGNGHQCSRDEQTEVNTLDYNQQSSFPRDQHAELLKPSLFAYL